MKIEKRGGIWVKDFGPGRGCIPATADEVRLCRDKLRIDWVAHTDSYDYPFGKTFRAAVDAAMRMELQAVRDGVHGDITAELNNALARLVLLDAELGE